MFNQYKNIKIIEGGKTRQESVFNGLKVLDSDYVLIHDGARPMITTQIIKNTITSVVEKKAVSVMTKTIDTIKEVDDEDIDLIKNNKVEDDDEGVEVEYSYEDDELIDIAINDDEE